MNIKDAVVGMKVRVIKHFEAFIVVKYPERNLGIITAIHGPRRQYEIQVNVNRYTYHDTRDVEGSTIWWFPASHLEPLDYPTEPLEPLEKKMFSINSLIEKFFKKEI